MRCQQDKNALLFCTAGCCCMQRNTHCTQQLVTHDTIVNLCLTHVLSCPALLPCMRHHQPFLCGPCFTTAAPGERWRCMHLWHVSMKLPLTCGACQQLLLTLLHEYMLVPWKGFLQLELPQQHGLVYESIDCTSWVITCCACPPSSALLGRILQCACKAVSWGMLEHF
jgi:hypothetical protein